ILPGRLALMSWTHLVVQSGNGIAGGNLQVYVDGNKLDMLYDAAQPNYPLTMDINGSGPLLPSPDLSVIKHIRFYNRTASDNEVLADYKNSCLGPVNGLLTDLQGWGEFNVPGLCNNNLAQTTAVQIPDRGALSVMTRPDPTGAESFHAF